MILSRLQCKRFFALFDALTVYANARLDVVGDAELMAGGPRGIDERAQAEVSRELWQNLNVIDDFVRENPAGLTAGELACVAAWRDGLTDTFLADIFPDGQIKFIGGGYAFEVTGLSKEIAAMIPELPAAVQATLLPFDGRIVYAEYLGLHAINFGDGMLQIFDEEIDRICDEDRFVQTADELLEVAVLLRESELVRDTEEMLADLESGRFASEYDAPGHMHVHGASCGHDHGHAPDFDVDDDFDYDEDFDPADFEQHCGVLAGLSFEEREQAIRAHMTERDESITEHLVAMLDDDCESIPLTTSLFGLLKAENIYDVRRFGKYLGMENSRELDGDELIQAVVEKVADAESVQVILNDLFEHQVSALHTLADKGGRWDVAEEDIVSLRELPLHELGFSYIFHEDGAFKFVMPDEIVAIAGKLDWDGAVEKARRYRELVDLVDMVVELRGIAPIGDVVAEYQRCYPDGFSTLQEIVRLIIQAVAEDIANYELLETPSREMYVLHYELYWAYEEVMGLEDDRYVSEPLTRGELGDLLENLLKQQEGKEPRPIDADMLAATNLYEWKLRQAPAFALTQYFDAHVPAAKDDYYFADKVMEDLIADAKWGVMNQAGQRLFDILDNNGFMPGTEQIQDILDLWSNMSNGLPVWPNNGWAPSEMAASAPGPRLFFNEDGSPMKIGRNDPCPCGSGLKYKKCCGR